MPHECLKAPSWLTAVIQKIHREYEGATPATPDAVKRSSARKHRCALLGKLPRGNYSARRSRGSDTVHRPPALTCTRRDELQLYGTAEPT